MKYSFGKNIFSFVFISILLLSIAAFVNDAWSMCPSEVEESKVIKRLNSDNAYQADYIKAYEELQKIVNTRHLLSNEDQTLFDKMLEDVNKRMNGTIRNPLLEGKEMVIRTVSVLGGTRDVCFEITKETKLSDLLCKLPPYAGIPISKIKIFIPHKYPVESPDLVLWNSSIMNYEMVVYGRAAFEMFNVPFNDE